MSFLDFALYVSKNVCKITGTVFKCFHASFLESNDSNNVYLKQKSINVNIVKFSLTFSFEFISKFAVMEVEDDNPFGPVCNCNMCVDSRAAIPYCTTCRPKPKRCPRGSQPTCFHDKAFKLHWQPKIPCYFCHETNCNHYLDTFSCEECQRHAKGTSK